MPDEKAEAVATCTTRGREDAPAASLQRMTGVDLKREDTRCGCRSLHLPLLQLLF
jgi:hypothetical protein